MDSPVTGIALRTAVAQTPDPHSERISWFREISKDREDEFYRKGYKRRYFFPHRVYYLPKAGPDGFKLASWMCGPCEPDQLWEVVLYAAHSIVERFPPEIFFDNELIWHQQQFGRTGQIASANLVREGDLLYTMVHISDLVQRISRSRTHKTQIENRFKGWHHMLLNAILNFAIEEGLKKIFIPTSQLALKNTDRTRNVGPELFERIYDRNVNQLFKTTQATGWWEIDVAENRERLVAPERRQEQLPGTKTICLCHDIERGFGHTDVDPRFAREVNQTSMAHLDEMLRIENKFGVKATYNVLGSLLPEVRDKIEAGGHSLGFHSFDHRIAGAPNPVARLWQQIAGRRNGNGVSANANDQLAQCRDVDYRIKGYRPPQSKLTAELTDKKLLFHNFEWFASSAYSLNINSPTIQKRIVRIPILFDDFELYDRGLKYDDWEKMALATVERSEFVAFSLHDCYGKFWLSNYEGLLERLMNLGTFKTLDQVAADVTFSNAI